MQAINDNPAPTHHARVVRIIGQVSEGGRVTITDPDWRPTPRPAQLRLVPDQRDTD